MEQENEQAPVVEEQEETTQPEEELDLELDLNDPETEPEESMVSIDKTELNRIKRKAIAYDTAKAKQKTAPRTEDVSDERLERLELRAEGYSPDEVQEIMDLGGTKVLANKVVQNAIKSMRAEKKSKDSMMDVSSKSPVYKKYTQQDLGKMTSKEMEKILAE